jgi:hypothetical protein
MQRILTKEKLATFGIEVIVVVLGILIAFQVDEWREDRQRGRDLDAALIRLAEETDANLQRCELVMPVHAHHAQSVLTVVRVLNDGNLNDADVALFDAGLIRVGYVTGAPYSDSVAEEMIATGLLKDLDNAELRNLVADLPVWIAGARSWDLDSRGSLQAAIVAVTKAVDFRYQGNLQTPEETDGPATGFEDGIRVNYVLEELVANRTLNNVFIEAADTHLDMWRNHNEVCGKFEEIRSSLNEMSRHQT